MNLNKLISEEINKYITESFFEKKEKKHSSSYNKYKEIQRRAKLRDGETISRSDEEILRALFDTNYFNEAAIAQEIYPDHTPEGAQSQLRKKLKGETNDNGSEYHLKEREAAAIRSIINKIKGAVG